MTHNDVEPTRFIRREFVDGSSLEVQIWEDPLPVDPRETWATDYPRTPADRKYLREYINSEVYGYRVVDRASSRILSSCWNFHSQSKCMDAGKQEAKKILASASNTTK